MFEYDLFLLRVYGFTKINYIDENRLEFKYKNKNLIVRGKNFKVYNLFDKSLEVKGIIESIDIEYSGVIHD